MLTRTYELHSFRKKLKKILTGGWTNHFWEVLPDESVIGLKTVYRMLLGKIAG